MKNIFIIVGLVIVLLGGIFLFRNLSGTLGNTFGNKGSVKINNQSFKVTLADTEKEKEAGLSGKKSLPQNEGMLFPFDKPDYYAFWMKDMQFPIDIIYIRGNKIVSIISKAKNPTTKEEHPQVYTPTAPADKVFEINAGLAEKYKIKPGDTVDISL